MTTEDLDIFLNDFGVSVTAGAVSTLGIFDAPSVELFGGEVLMEDYQVTVRTDELGGLLYGDAITIDGENYQVKEPRALADGKFTALLVEKLAPPATAPGGTPRRFSLADLYDVDISGAVPGDALTFNGTEWIAAAKPITITVPEPQVGDQFTLPIFPTAITFTDIIAVVRGTNASVEFEIRYSSVPDRSAGGTLANVPELVTNTTNGEVVVPQNMPIPAASYIWLEVTSVVGVVSELNVSIKL